MDAFFLLHAEAATGITSRAKVLLDCFADGDILDLNLVAEIDGRFGRGRTEILFGQIPFKDGERALRFERQDNIERDIIGIAVQHPVGEDPEVIGGEVFAGFLIAPRSNISRLCAANWAELADVALKRFDDIGVVVEFAIQTGMDAGQVISLEIVIDVCFPIAPHFVDASLKQLHTDERKFPGLLRQTPEALFERRRIRIEVYEDEIEPNLDAKRHEREILRAESFDTFDFRRVDERAVKTVSPSVIGAAKQFS